MSISIFTNPEKEQAKSYVTNLIRMAAADHVITAEEVSFIQKIGSKKGLKEKEITRLLTSDVSGEIQIPSSKADRFDLLYDIVNLMFADGTVQEEEEQFCYELAAKMDFNSTVVELLVGKIERAIINHDSYEKVKEQSVPLIEY